jgi:hypothetical protein
MSAATRRRNENVADSRARLMTFTIDQATDQVLEDLKTKLGKTSKAEVLRKAIALLDVATEAEKDGGIATIDSRGNIHQRIKLV